MGETEAEQKRILLDLYRIKRTFCFFDEWAFYGILLYLWLTQWPLWIILIVAVYGGLATYTTYKNLGNIQRRIGAPDVWMFCPFIYDNRDIAL